MQILFKECTTRVIMSKKKKVKVIQKKKNVVAKKLFSKKDVKTTIKKTPLVKKPIQKAIKPTVLKKAPVKVLKKSPVKVLKKAPIKILKKVQNPTILKKIQKPTDLKKTVVAKKIAIKKVIQTPLKEKKFIPKILQPVSIKSNKKTEEKPVKAINKEIKTTSEKNVVEQEVSAFKGSVLSKSFFDWNTLQESLRNLSFFHQKDSEECQEKNCDQMATTIGYCRFHYIKNIKKIKVKREILSQDRLQKAMEILFLSYPVDVIEYLLKCLQEEKNFYQLLRDFNIADMDYQEEVVVVEEEEDDLGFPQTFLKQGFEE